LQPGNSISLDGKVTLPSARLFPGQIEIRNTNPFELRASFHGDTEWISGNEIPTSTRVFIYTESRLSADEISQLKQRARDLGERVQFRSADHAEARSREDHFLAFISHD